MSLPFLQLRDFVRSRRRQPRRRILFELLEDRTVPTVSTSFGGGLLTVTLDTAGDTAIVSQNGSGEVFVNSVDTGTNVSAATSGISIVGAGATMGQTVTFDTSSGAALNLAPSTTGGITMSGVQSTILDSNLTTPGGQTFAGGVTLGAAVQLSHTGTLSLGGPLLLSGNTLTDVAAAAASGTITGAITGPGGVVEGGLGTLLLPGVSNGLTSLTVNSGVVKIGPGVPSSIVGGSAAYTNSAYSTYTAAPNDLLAGLMPTSVTNSGALLENTGGPQFLTNQNIVFGGDGNTGVNNPATYSVGDNASLTYTLGLGFGSGYDLTRINLFAGWNDNGRSEITVTNISYSTVAAQTTFTPIANSGVDFTANGSLNLSSLFTSSGNAFASGVYAIQFNFGPQENHHVGYREIEVVGVPTSLTTDLSAASVNVGAAGTLDVGGNTLVVGSVTGTGIVLNSGPAAGAFAVLGSGISTFGGVFASGGANGALSLAQAGSGTLVLNSATPTYGASAAVIAGTLQIGDGVIPITSLPSAPILNNTSLVFDQAPTGIATSGAAISGLGSVTVIGSGTIGLSATNTYTGPTNINSGTLNLAGSTSASSTVNIATAGTLGGSGTVNGNATLTGNGIINFASAGKIAGTLAVTGGNWNGLGTVAGVVRSTTGTFALASGSILTAPGAVVESGGNLSLSGTIVGSLIVNGTPTVTVGAGGTVTVLDASAGTGTVNATVPLTITGTLKLGSGFVATGTTLTATGSNIVNDAQTGSGARTLASSTGTLSLSQPLQLVNSSFEADPGNANSYQYTPLTGWTTSNPGSVGIEQGSSRIWSTNIVPNFDAATNFKWAFIQDGTLNQVQTLSQVFSVPAASTYTVSFAAEGRPGQGPTDIKVQIDGVDVLAQFTPSQSQWNTYTTSPFTVVPGNHTLAFLFIDALGGDRSDVLDQVTINRANASAAGSPISFPNTTLVVPANLTLDLGASPTTFGTVQIAAGANLTVQNGATLSAGNLNVTGAAGSSTVSTGTVALNLSGNIKAAAGTSLTLGAATLGAGVTIGASDPSGTGTVVVNGPLAASGSGATYSLVGGTLSTASLVTANGALAVPGGFSATGSTLNVGGPGVVGSLALAGNLTVDGSSTFNFDFLNAGSFDTIAASTGTLSLVGSGAPTLNVSGSGIAAGTYNLITYASHSDANSFTLGSTPGGNFNYALSTTATAVQLIITSKSSSLIWDNVPGAPINDGTGNWADHSTNFFDATNGVPATFSNANTFDVAFGNGGTGATVSLTGDVRTGGLLTFAPLSAGNYVLSGTHTLTTVGGITASYSATINAPILLGASQIWSVAPGQTLSIGGLIGESPAGASLTKSGSGTLVLGGGATYTGGTTIGAGTIQLAAGNQLPVAGSVTFLNASGATLDLNGFNQTLGSILGGGNLAGNISLGAGILTVGDSTSTTYAGSIRGVGGIVKQGSGTLSLTGTNLYSGTTNVNNGVLVAGAAQTLPAGDVINVNAGATFNATAAGALNGVLINILPGGIVNPTVAGALNGAIININGGTLNASVANAFSTSVITLNSGTLNPSIADGLSGASVTIAAAATLSPTVADSLRSATIVIMGGTLAMGANSAVASLSLQSGNVTGSTSVLTSTAVYDLQSGTVSAILAGSAGANKTTTGTVTLSGADTFTGSTNVSAGTLNLTGSLASGNTLNIGTAGTLTGTGTVGGNATLTGSGVINLTNPATIVGTLGITGGTWSGAGTVAGLVTSSTGAFTLAATGVLTAPKGVLVSGGTTALNGSIVGTLTVTGTPVVTVGMGASVTGADLSAGTGTVDATNPLLVTTTLKLAGNIVGSGTAMTVSGSNITNDNQTGSLARTIAASSGTLSLVGQTAPSNVNSYTYRTVSSGTTGGVPNSGISSANVYTHAIDFNGITTTGANVPNPINGVTFQNYFGMAMTGTQTDTGNASGNPNNFTSVSQSTDPGLFSLLNDFTYGNNTNPITLTGLTPGTYYEMRIYARTFGQITDSRLQTFNAFIGNSTTPANTWTVNEDNPLDAADTPAWNALVAANGGFTTGQAWAMGFVYQADAAGTFTLTPTALNSGDTFHLYGLTNQVVPAAPSTYSIPNTRIVAAGSTTLDLGSASLNDTVGQIVVSGGATLTVQDGASLTVNGIASTGAGAATVTTGSVQLIDTGDIAAATTGSLSLPALTLQGNGTNNSLFNVGATGSTGLVDFTGPTAVTGTNPTVNIAAGTAQVDNVLSGATVSIAAGATLAGAGSVDAIVNNGGTVNPGVPGTPDALTVAGNLTLGTGSLALDLTNASTFDSVIANGSTNVTGTTLSLNVGTVSAGQSFTIIDVPSASPAVTGFFVGLPGTNSTITVGSQTFSIDYAGGPDHNDVVLTAVNNAAVSVTSTVQNGGIAYLNNTLDPAQHSMIENLVYSFSGAVNLSASNFTITGLAGSGTTIVPTLNVAHNVGNTVWTVTFSGAGVNPTTNSIGDGEYQVVVGGVPGLTSNTYDFFRLLGDLDGTGLVNIADFNTVVGTFLRATNDPAYLGAADLDGDGAVGIADINLLIGNFLHSVPQPLPN